MSALIDMTNNRANFAFLGSRNDIWHRMGQQMQDGMTIEQWATQAGLSHDCALVPAIANLAGSQFDHIPAGERFRVVDGRRHIVRVDTGHPLGYASDGYQIVQPRAVLDWFRRYLAHNDLFVLDAAGALKHGQTVWATAVFRDPLVVGGDEHRARILMTTTYDGTGSTINQATVTRVVCANTLHIATQDRRAVVRTRHSTKFDAKAVSKELSTLAQGFQAFKVMGDAMAQTDITLEDTSRLFKHILDIPFETPKQDISTRKMNQFQQLRDAYADTVAEGTQPNTVWAALQSVTRYVDHDKAAKANGDSVDVKRFASAQFGSGAAMKAKAVQFLMPRIADKVAV